MNEQDRLQYIDVLLALSGHGNWGKQGTDKNSEVKSDLSTFVHEDKERPANVRVIASC